MEIVLVRHGQPQWESIADNTADDDPGLTPFGRSQARRSSEALAGEPFDTLYVSPMKRARETAEPIARQLNLEPQVESWLREIELPPMAGKTRDEVEHYFESARARQLADWWDGLPGGESFRHFYERVSAGIEGLLAGRHRIGIHEDGGHRLWQVPEPQRLVFVAHEGTNAVLLSHLLGIEPVPWAWMRFSSSWTGITHLRSVQFPDGAVWALDHFNRTRHLIGLRDESHGDGRSHR